MRSEETDIAVVGIACRFPGVTTVEQFWALLRDGVEALTDFDDQALLDAGVAPELLADPAYVKRGAVIDGLEDFDAEFFGYAPSEAALLDPQFRIFLECAWEALEAAGYAGVQTDRDIGVYAGAGVNTYFLNNLVNNPRTLEDFGPFQMMIANDKDYLATLVSYKLNLTGPAMTVQSACSTSLVAVHQACQSLLSGECDLALAGGVGISVPTVDGYLYQDGMISSPDGRCRPFSDDSAGTVDGAGAAVVTLQLLEDAIADGATIYAVIKGTAINNDGAAKVGYTAPSVEGQARVITEAQRVADVRPGEVGFIEAHGTATPLGDPIEVAALKKVWSAAGDGSARCALGSVKSNLGHTGAAAGVSGLIKAVLSIHHRQIPPTLHFRAPNPETGLADSPFFVNTTTEDWPAPGSPRIAGVSSFGIGGTNAHVIAGEAPAAKPAPRQPRGASCHILPLSAHTPEALSVGKRALAAYLAAHPDEDPGAVAHTLQQGRKAFGFRDFVVGEDLETLVRALEEPAPPARPAPERRSAAFMMTGHGSQTVGMARCLFDQEPVFRECVRRLAGRFLELESIDLSAVFNAGEAEKDWAQGELDRMSISQPLMFIVQMALAALWRSWGIEPAAVVGHSSGEYAAACVAGVFSEDDALRLIGARGRLMDRTAPGGMVALNQSERELSRFIDDGLSVGVINAGDMCVVSGFQDALERFTERLDGLGVDYRRLHISIAAHSPTMDAVGDEFLEATRAVHYSAPRVPYVSGVDGGWSDGADIARPEYWARHLRATVRFHEAVACLTAEPDLALIEIGPGNALSTFARMSPGAAPDLTCVQSLPHPQRDTVGDDVIIARALGTLWAAGCAVDWRAYGEDRTHRLIPLPTIRFQRRRCWIDAVEAPSVARETTARRRADPDRWFHYPSWRRSPLPVDGRTPQRVVLFAEDGSPAAALGPYLEAKGCPVTVCRPGDDMDYEALVRSKGADSALFVHAWALGEEKRDEAEIELGFESLCRLGRALGANDDKPADIVILTSGTQAVTGGEDLIPVRALIHGPAKVIPQEFPHLRTHVIDIDSCEAERIAALLGAPDKPALQALRGGRRWLSGVTEAPLAETAPRLRPLREGGVYLITGGFGGVGLTVAERLARDWRARLVLIGRSGPSSQAAERLNRLEAEGGELRRRIADCADFDRMKAIFEETEDAWGRIDGVIHAAGQTGPAMHQALDAFSTRQSAAQFRAKVEGTRVLERLLEEREVDFCVLMSSLASVLGGLGLAAYAGANAYLDLTAWRLNQCRPGRWLAMNWDSWRAGPDGEERIAVKTFEGLEMNAREGLNAFLRALSAAPEPQVMISPGALTPRLAQWIDLGPRRQQQEMEADLPSAAPVPLDATPVQAALIAIWNRFLGQTSIDLDANFFALGGHSLMATRVLGRIKKAFGVSLPLATLFAQPTLRAMAAEIEAAGGRALAPESAPAPAGWSSGPAPLAPPQRQIWLAQRLVPQSPIYNVPLALRLRGALDRKALGRAVDEIASRHEALRTVFPIDNGEPRPKVLATIAPVLTHTDTAGADDATIDAWIAAEAGRVFDLAKGPLVRARLFRVANDDHVFVVVMHHIITDGWSLALFMRELGDLYDAFANDRAPSLPSPERQYADFAREAMDAAERERQRAFWHRELADLPARHALATDRPLPETRGFESDVVTVLLPPELTERLQAFASAEGCSLFMTLLAGFSALLYRYTDVADQPVITSSANRAPEWRESVFGLFVSMLVMRMRPTGEQSFRLLSRAARQTTLNAFAHQDVPFQQLVEDLNPPRNPNQHPLAQIGFVVQNLPIDEAAPIGGLEMDYLPSVSNACQYDLLCSITQNADTLAVSLEYGTELFDRDTIRRLGDHFALLMEACVNEPDRPIRTLPMLTPAETETLAAWSVRSLPPPDGCESREPEPGCETVIDLIRANARRRPDAPAVRYEENALTYADLTARMDETASRLRALGVCAGDAVAVELPRGIEPIVAFLGVLAAGAVYLPLDGAQPAARRRVIRDDAGPVAEITEDGMRRIAEENNSVGDGLAYVIYTSGSTGEPKGVMITHAGLLALANEQRRLFGAGPDGRVLQLANCSFDAWIFEVVMALGGGATLITACTEALTPGPDLAATLRETRVTHLTITPPALAVLPRGAYPDLKVLIAAGAALDANLARAWCGGRILFNAYGPTETTVCATAGLCDPDAGRFGIGRPLGGLSVHILDAHGNRTPIGVPGELHVGGIGLAAGYLGRPDLTAERFVASPVADAPHDRLYATGDQVAFDHDGELCFLGRRDEQLKIRGFRIEPAEIEACLNGHPAVRQSLVIGHRQDAETRLAAYVVPVDGSVDTDALRRHVAAALPDFMVPAFFTAMDALPLTPSGKPDIARLPDPTQGHADVCYMAPRDDIETRLCTLWERCLGVGRVGLRRNFFEAGGNSLQAVRLAAAIQAEFGLSIPVAALITRADVESQAAWIRTGGMATPPPPPAAQPGSGAPISFWIPGIGGHAVSFAPLLRSLADVSSVRVLSPRGHDGLAPPDRRLAAVVARHVETIRREQPDGPYRIGGHSFGSQIAWMTANALIASGAEVELLCILDGFAPGASPDSEHDAADSPLHLLHWLIHDLLAMDGEEMDQAMSAFAQLDYEDALGEAPAILGRRSDLSLTSDDLRAMVRVREAGMLQRREAVAPPSVPLGVPCLLVTARNGASGLAAKGSDLGWGAFVASPRIRSLEATHASLLASPQAETIAELWREALRDARNGAFTKKKPKGTKKKTRQQTAVS